MAAIADRGPVFAPGAAYRYSDLGFILLGAAIEAVADTSLAGFLDTELWTPLGMDDTGFDPVQEPRDTAAADTPSSPYVVPLSRIAPTELDTVFRRTHVHGQVHDENAWAMGGVAGHAGLFSTAPDLARFAHMLLRTGRAGEWRLLSPDVVARFTTREPGTGRALGWDAHDPDERDAGGRAIEAPFSDAAFGHTGFTGTSLWIDPERDLYVILLTNRVNPTRARGGIRALRRAVHEWAVRAVETDDGVAADL